MHCVFKILSFGASDLQFSSIVHTCIHHSATWFATTHIWQYSHKYETKILT